MHKQFLSQAAGKFEVEESGSAVMNKPDPTGTYGLKMFP